MSDLASPRAGQTIQEVLIGSAVIAQQRVRPEFRCVPATVVQASNPLAVTIVLDGSLDVVGAQSLIGPLLVGARVMTMLVPPHGVLVVGYGTVLQPGSNEVLSTANNTGTTASVTYVNWPTGGAVAATFTKAGDASRIRVDLKVSFFHTVANGAVDYGVRIDSVDYTVIENAFANELASHKCHSGMRLLTGVTAGVKTVTVRARTSAGTINADANDEVTLALREVP